MPEPPEEPRPLPSRESRFAPPLEAQEASYFAASARISSLFLRSIAVPTARDRGRLGRSLYVLNPHSRGRTSRGPIARYLPGESILVGSEDQDTSSRLVVGR